MFISQRNSPPSDYGRTKRQRLTTILKDKLVQAYRNAYGTDFTETEMSQLPAQQAAQRMAAAADGRGVRVALGGENGGLSLDFDADLPASPMSKKRDAPPATKRVLGINDRRRITEEEKASGRQYEALGELSEQLRLASKDNTFADVVLLIGRNPTHKIYAHRFVLINRSQYFRNIFLTKKEQFEDLSKKVALEFPRVQHVDVFQKVLDYLYTGQICLRLDDVIEVIALADLLQVPSLKDICGRYAELHIDSDNACLLLEMARKYRVEYLEQVCLDYIDRHAIDVLRSVMLQDMTEGNLIYVVKRSELQIEPEQEIEVFSGIYRWAQYRQKKKQARLDKVEAQRASRRVNDEESDVEHFSDSDDDEDDDEEDKGYDADADNLAAVASIASPLTAAAAAAAAAASSNADTALASIVKRVVEHVRFPLMTSDQLVNIVEPCNIVPQPLLFEAYRHHLVPQKSDRGNCQRFYRRAAQGEPGEAAAAATEALPSSQRKPLTPVKQANANALSETAFVTPIKGPAIFGKTAAVAATAGRGSENVPPAAV